MKTAKAKLIIFTVGAFGYGLIEIVWRGYTHWSMLCAGGLSFCGLSVIAEKFKRIGSFSKAVLGGALITFIELGFGIIFNLILKKNVWDYSRMPFNLFGQICAVYSAFWVIISFFTIPLATMLNNKLKMKIG